PFLPYKPFDEGFNAVDGNGKADALRRLCHRDVDADDFAVDVDERSAAVARVDGSVSLHDVRVIPFGRFKRTIFGADDADGHRMVKTEGVADGDDPLAGFGFGRRAEFERFQHFGVMDAQHGQIPFVVRPYDVGRSLLRIP